MAQMADDAPGSGESAATSIWLRARRETRDRAVLTRDRIVSEAVDLLDAEGIGRLTMRRLAERLDTGSTTLYWHVDTKADVLDLALDAVWGEIELPADDGTWRAHIVDLLGGWRATMLRHPWTAALLGRPMLGPNMLSRMEVLHAELARAGLPGSASTAIGWALCSQVMGSAAAEATFDMAPSDRDAGRRALHEQADRYPTLVANDFMESERWEENFLAGIDVMLDGVERMSPRR